MPALTDLGAILGSMYLGGMGAAMYVSIEYKFILCWTYCHYARRLFGVTILQVYFYFRNYREDGLFSKLTILFLGYENTRV